MKIKPNRFLVGVAIALMAGELSGLLIRRIAVLVLYYAFNHLSQLNPGHHSAKDDADHGADPRIGREGTSS